MQIIIQYQLCNGIHSQSIKQRGKLNNDIKVNVNFVLNFFSKSGGHWTGVTEEPLKTWPKSHYFKAQQKSKAIAKLNEIPFNTRVVVRTAGAGGRAVDETSMCYRRKESNSAQRRMNFNKRQECEIM
jgi:hypothetical protein